jgi:hypothetical protein
MKRKGLRFKVRKEGFNATPALGIVRGPRLKTRADFVSLAHEIGHCTGKRAKYRLDEELRAWQNAHRFLPSWHNNDSKQMARALISYEEWADKRFHRSIAWKRAIVKARMVIK